MNVLLIDLAGKITNLALMKLSTFYKSMGYNVYLNDYPKAGKPDIVHCSVLFDWDKEKAERLKVIYPNIQFGGTGWDKKIKLTDEQEACKPDFDLYSVDDIYRRLSGGCKTEEKKFMNSLERVNSGIGFTTRGCVNCCEFCCVPEKEGYLRQASKIEEIINPKSKKLFLLDNNFTADPLRVDKLEEMVERKLEVKFSQGIDVKLIDDETASYFKNGKLKLWGSLPYAWDLMESEERVLDGIKLLSQYVPVYKHTCFVLVGFNTTHEEDMHRVMTLTNLGVRPYIMRYNNRRDDIRLNHFARWVTGFFYKKCSFDEYTPWIDAQIKLRQRKVQLCMFDEGKVVV